MEDLTGLRKESGVFWVEVDKIRPNSMQPRRVFDEQRLNELSDSIKQYGVLQPLVVIRHEKEVPTGAVVDYELIAGERRWRASQIAGLGQVPVIIREDPSEKVKLELALIENLQREDLSPMERADAFKQLADEFKMRHHEIGSKVGKSREFVSNTIRLLALPEEIQEGLKNGLISEGHTRPLLSLSNQKDDQMAFYKEIIYRKMTVREAENAGRELSKKSTLRKIKQEFEDPETQVLERQLSDVLGTRVSVEPRGVGKKISIEFFSEEELKNFLSKVGASQEITMQEPESTEEIPDKEPITEEPEIIAQTINNSAEEIETIKEEIEADKEPELPTEPPANPPVEKPPEAEKVSWLKDFSI
ncbi:ParB/RepB/Spo0J family partition protein [Patescibacteria group bacterium]